MVHGVAGSTIDDRAVGNVFSIVNEDSPEIDKSEENHIGEFLKGQNEWEDVVRYALRPAIKRMESVRCEWGGHDPLVMRLVQSPVDTRMMQSAVNPVDEEVRKHDKKRELDQVVKRERSI